MLKKQPESNLGRALKAVALDMLDREMEALSLCNNVKAAKPTDPPVLRALSNVYERHGYSTQFVLRRSEARMVFTHRTCAFNFRASRSGRSPPAV